MGGHHVVVGTVHGNPNLELKQTGGGFSWPDCHHHPWQGWSNPQRKLLPKESRAAECRASGHAVNEAAAAVFTDSRRSSAAHHHHGDGDGGGGLQAAKIPPWTVTCELRRGHDVEEAVESLDRLVQKGGSRVSSSVIYGVLKKCMAHKDLARGSRVHALAVQSGYGSDAFLANHIICMYAAHGRVAEAVQAFRAVPSPSRYMWASIILAHARHGRAGEAIRLYREMRRESSSGVKPDDHVFLAVLKACASAKSLEAGREVHVHVILAAGGAAGACDGKEQLGMFVATGLVDMYAKCGSLADARKVFDSLPSKDVVTWNAMIAGYSQHGLGQEALTLYAAMQQQGSGRVSAANQVTYLALLQACGSVPAGGGIQHGRQLHSEIRARGLDRDVVLGNCLIDMYAKCGSLEEAQSVFDGLSAKSVVTWTAMISGCTQHGQGRRALELYARMRRECAAPPDVVTFICLLQACGSVKDLRQGRELHSQITHRGMLLVLVDSDSSSSSSSDDDDSSNSNNSRNTSSSSNNNRVVLGNCLVDMYAKCGSLEDARSVFNSLRTKDAVSWNCMIAGYAQAGRGQDALTLYALMKAQGVVPRDPLTLVSLLQACGSVAALERGQEVHALVSALGLERTHLTVANALIDMYGKCGCMAEAQRVFDNAVPCRDIVSWNALMAGLARQGDRDAVVGAFFRLLAAAEREPELKPNGVTYLSVLTACSHAGLVSDGQRFFARMMSTSSSTVAPTIEHYTCMVDLLGRTGRVDEALDMVLRMPVPPDAAVWRSVLGACRKWKRVDLAHEAFRRAVAADPADAAAYVLMANVLAAAGRRDEAARVQALRLRNGARKPPGQSWWTDPADGAVHTFVVVGGGGGGHQGQQHRHPEWRGIEAKLTELVGRMKAQHGYVPRVESVLRDLPEQADKEAALCGHSEKLAIAYALMRSPEGSTGTVRVVKNLRVCEDCHVFTALVSKMERRSIVCRDASRFHVFSDGKCSCNDYW